ncbi:MAG: sigma-70 family RNA polymerase sigma factor [Planctomycetes bacterium]|nr:sigma-70 family RNA polymerase sigma factor [Planctomycetota bacterium]MCH8119555.1 sigma-70 family RNA polymerase sigma factor [Planctomycetota bacterium]
MAEVANINVDDAVLVRQCRQGDSAAMERLILKYQNRIYNVILKICADHDDAAELTQETFVKVIENIDNFQGRSSFYTWAFRIAVNLTLNYCQRNARFGFSSLDAEQVRYNSQPGRVLKEFLSDDSSPDPVAMAENRELCEIAVESLKKLDDAQRAVVVLRDIEDMSYAQIANVLDIELGTVRSRLSRGRKKLRQILEAILQ